MSLPYKTGVFHPAFSPWLANPEQLSRTLVGNEEIIRDFLARLAAMDSGSSANHVLLVGPRGIGKTHLLCLTGHYGSRRLPVPKDWAFPASDWICALFTEEEYAGQNSLANFLLSLFEKLSEAIPGESFLCLPTDLAGKPDKAVVECCFETLRRYYEKIGKRLLILVDNLQKVLQQWTTEEHHQLRKFLSAGRFVVILGSAPSVFREVLDQKAALHDFFEIRILSELTTDQVMELLGKRFQEDQRAEEFNSRREELARKVAAIEVLTGGNPRLVLFLYQIATGSTFWEIETALRMLLEELREYFVRRFDELPDQARKILDTIAQMPGPATPSEIAAAARVRPQLVNAQLQRLKTSHLVRQIKLKRQRATRYDITERLFRIWRQTATVAGRQRFKFLADFLRLYFTPDEVQNLYRQHVAGLTLSADTAREEILRHIDELFYFYFQAGGEGPIRYDAFASRIESLLKLGEMHWAEEEARYFESESRRLSDRAGIIEACKQALDLHLDTGRLPEALVDLEKLVKERADEEVMHAAEIVLQHYPGCTAAWRTLCVAAGKLRHYERAFEASSKAVEMGMPTAELWCLKSLALVGMNRKEEAMQAAEQAVALDRTDPRIWETLGIAALSLGNHEPALDAFRKAVRLGRPSAALWRFQSLALRGLNRKEEALLAADEAVALDPANSLAWKAVGIAAGSVGKYSRALEAFRKAADAGKCTAELSSLQSIMLRNLNRMDEALQLADQATQLAPENARGWLLMAWTCGYCAQFDKAISAIEHAVACGALEKDVRHARGDILLLSGRYEEALRELEVGLEQNAEDWDFRAGCKIARACLGEFGPLMEALPAQLLMSKIPPGSELAMSEFLRDVTLNALRRNETTVPCGLWNTLLSLESYHGFEWYGPLCGDFLRRLLDITPGQFVDYAERLREKVKNDGVLRLLDPFLQAAAFIRTRDVTIFERLFPEVRELVLDIVRRISPDLVNQLRL